MPDRGKDWLPRASLVEVSDHADTIEHNSPESLSVSCAPQVGPVLEHHNPQAHLDRRCGSRPTAERRFVISVGTGGTIAPSAALDEALMRRRRPEQSTRQARRRRPPYLVGDHANLGPRDEKQRSSDEWIRVGNRRARFSGPGGSEGILAGSSPEQRLGRPHGSTLAGEHVLIIHGSGLRARSLEAV